jgi:hypothetical protein
MGCYWRGLCAECARITVEMHPGGRNWKQGGVEAPERGYRKGQRDLSMMVIHDNASACLFAGGERSIFRKLRIVV